MRTRGGSDAPRWDARLSQTTRTQAFHFTFPHLFLRPLAILAVYLQEQVLAKAFTFLIILVDALLFFKALAKNDQHFQKSKRRS